MTYDYLLARPTPRYSATLQIKLRLSPGDGLEGLHSSPIWF
jgi:hypothetical protein